MMENLWLFTDK